MNAVAEAVAKAAGHVMAPYVAAVVLAVLWTFLGLDATNFAISIISLLLLFVLQSTQTRDGLAIQIKLDTLIAAIPEADDAFQRIDEKTADEVRELRT